MEHSDLKKRFQVVCVKDGDLVARAQALRAKVFFDSATPDSDKFDAYCDHLVALDLDHAKVVGTYRLLRGSVAKETVGFYSETEFDLTNIKKNCTGEILEMGRACVLTSYRRFPVINLIWKAILEYVDTHSVDFIIGCASMPHTPSVTGAVSQFLQKNHLSLPCYRVCPRVGIPSAEDNGSSKSISVENKLPSLIKGYLKMGAHVCGEPAWDEHFNTADFFMLLDVKRMDAEYKEKFL